MELEEQAKFIPTLHAMVKKINQMGSFTGDEKTFLSAILANQVHIQTGSAEIITHDDIDIYSFGTS